MAETQDLRSEGKNSDTPQAVSNRKLRAFRKAQDLCITCGAVRLKNRTQCYACVKQASEYNRRSNFRKHLSEHGVDLDEVIQLMSDKPKYKNLKKALIAALPKIKVH